MGWEGEKTFFSNSEKSNDINQVWSLTRSSPYNAFIAPFQCHISHFSTCFSKKKNLSNDYKWQRKLQEEKVTHVYIFNFLYLLSFFEFFLIYSQSNSNSSLFFLLEFLPIPSLETLSVCTEKKLLLWTFPLYSCYFHPRFLSAWIKEIFLM